MKLPSFILLALWALLMLASCKDDDPEPVFPSKLEEKTFTSQALQGNFFGDPAERNVLVYTPWGYDPEGKTEYPVAYLLHGMPLGDSSFVSWNKWKTLVPGVYPDLPPEGFQAWMDTLIAKGDIEPMIIVMPDAKSKYGFCFFTNSVLQGNYADFIAEDLVNYMDDNYKTIANRNGRAVIGHSQGGVGAINMGMYYPETFGTIGVLQSIPYFEGLFGGIPFVIADNPNGMNGPHADFSMTTVIYGMCAAFSPNLNNPPWYVDLPFEYPSGNIIPSVWARFLEHDPFTLVGTKASQLKSLNGFYMDAATSDAWYDLSVAYHQGLEAQGVPHVFETFPGDHFSGMFSRLRIALKYYTDVRNN
jgi:enterochelin esterase-like enzyme